jgi:hypothetical protein
MVTVESIRRDLPQVIDDGKGSINFVLACIKVELVTKDRTITKNVPRWSVVNSRYYCDHARFFEGWIDLQQ